MRILYGITKSNWGGAQRYVFDMAVAARDAGHEVAVLAGGDGVLIEKLRSTGIRVISLPHMERDVRIGAEIRSFIDLYKILRRERPDVFHINSSKMGGLGALAARLARIKRVVFTAHGWAFNEPRHWVQKIIIEELSWLTVLFAHKTICVSEAIKRDIERKPLIKDKLVVIKHGIERFKLLARDISRERLWPGVKEDEILVGTIAELHKVKGLDVTIKGFSRAFKYTDTKLVIISGGEEKENLESLIRSLGVEAQVRLLGFIDNARELLRGLDIFTFTSRSEALGIAVLEAGIASLPVIASKVGGIPEIITDGESGILIPSEDTETLSKALVRLKDPEERKRFGKNLNRTVQENFSKTKMISETLSLYR